MLALPRTSILSANAKRKKTKERKTTLVYISIFGLPSAARNMQVRVADRGMRPSTRSRNVCVDALSLPMINQTAQTGLERGSCLSSQLI